MVERKNVLKSWVACARCGWRGAATVTLSVFEFGRSVAWTCPACRVSCAAPLMRHDGCADDVVALLWGASDGEDCGGAAGSNGDSRMRRN